MFHAFVLICAATFGEPNADVCIRLDDTWGPYRTEENCLIRSNQIFTSSMNGDLDHIIFDSFLNEYQSIPEDLYIRGFCIPSNQFEV